MVAIGLDFHTGGVGIRISPGQLAANFWDEIPRTFGQSLFINMIALLLPRMQAKRRSHGSYHATSSCMWLLEADIYNFYTGSIGGFATWQELWMLAIVGSGFNMVSFRLGKGQGGAHLMQLRCLHLQARAL